MSTVELGSPNAGGSRSLERSARNAVTEALDVVRRETPDTDTSDPGHKARVPHDEKRGQLRISVNAMVKLSTFDNALDSVRRIPDELGKGSDLFAVKAVLSWGWHAIALLAHMRLRPAREVFDHWFWDYLDAGEPELDAERDARWEERQRLSLLELLDVFSREDLEILKPEFYQGWQDRRTRCRTLRRRVAETIGSSIDAEHRENLVRLLGAYHRLLRLPAGVEMDSEDIVSALPALFDLIEMLVEPTHSSAGRFGEAIEACRAAMRS